MRNIKSNLQYSHHPYVYIYKYTTTHPDSLKNTILKHLSMVKISLQKNVNIKGGTISKFVSRITKLVSEIPATSLIYQK